jgi:AraC family transcriptional regulator
MHDLPNVANLDYVHRVNRAIDHITRHLAEPLPLDEVARVACFSPYHFHRIQSWSARPPSSSSARLGAPWP